MNRPNGVRAAYAAFLLPTAVGFGHATVLHTLKEAYPYHSIVLHQSALIHKDRSSDFYRAHS